jgi:hypothetical protein
MSIIDRPPLDAFSGHVVAAAVSVPRDDPTVVG